MNTNFYKLSRGAGKGSLYFETLIRAVQFSQKEGATTLKILADNPLPSQVVEAFDLQEIHMVAFHRLSQAVNRTKLAIVMDQFGKKIGEIKALSFFKNLEPNVENPTQQYVEKRAGK